jgi:hypothetical protein
VLWHPHTRRIATASEIFVVFELENFKPVAKRKPTLRDAGSV